MGLSSKGQASTIKNDSSVSGTTIKDALETLNSGIPQVTPLIYKALISQNAPVATTTDPTMVAGQIWTLDAYNAADAATIAGLELISGTLYEAGSKYRSATDQTLNVNVATTLSYDGAPYIVSTDANDDFSSVIDTIGGTAAYSINGTGDFIITNTNKFPDIRKVLITLNNNAGDPDRTESTYWNNADSLGILTKAGGITSDNVLYFATLSIEVYP